MTNGWWIPILAAGIVAHAASFDCAKAKTPQEKAICASPELSAADDKMAAAYKAALAAARPEKKAAVRDGQRAWLHATVDQCVIPGPASPRALPDCLLGYYQARNQQLSNLAGTSHDAFVTRFVELTWPDEPGESPGSEGIPGYGTLTATWPQSTIAAAEWQAWNKAVEAAAQRLVVSSHGSSPSGEWQKEWAAAGDFEIDASVDLVSEVLVTASIGLEGMGHGAGHPSEAGIEFNWLLKQKRELRPEDVFRKGSDWEKAIEARCAKELQQPDAGLYDDWEKALPKVVLDQRNWQLDGKGLTIDFPEYTVAPRVSPVGPVTIPWADLKPLLNPAFEPPAERVEKPAQLEQ
jgi:uncharacterized protein